MSRNVDQRARVPESASRPPGWPRRGGGGRRAWHAQDVPAAPQLADVSNW